MKKTFLLAIGIVLGLLWMGPGADAPGSRAAKTEPPVPRADDKVALIEEKLSGIVREVTAYNVGVKKQTSDTPCIGARGNDLCELVERGRKICAANFVSMGAILRIEKYGECVVLDRVNRRYAHRVDIAMKESEVEEALEFGLQRRVVDVIY
jgi:3D (Asp-Asp-Asp) domain-containing protein